MMVRRMLLPLILTRILDCHVEWYWVYALSKPRGTPRSMVVGDFNLDENLDIAIGLSGDGIQVFLGDGLGGFTPLESFGEESLTRLWSREISMKTE